MPKAVATKTLQKSRKKRVSLKVSSLSGKAATRQALVKAVLEAAEKSGLLREKSSRIGGRISSALIKQAKKQTGIVTDSDLIEFALANIALEDNFAEKFKKSRGKVDPTLTLGF